MYGLQAEAHFDGAHFLTDYYGKCENLHGHRWRVVATIEVERLQGAHDGAGELRDDGTSTAAGTMRDMVVDFGVFKRTVAERGLPVSQVEVDETPNNRAFYARDGHVGR